MLASTRGPSMKPAWAATNSKQPSEMIVTSTNPSPSQAGRCSSSTNISDKTVFIVLSATRADVQQQVGDHQSAGRQGQREGHQSMVCWPVCTRGSRITGMLLETASMPV